MNALNGLSFLGHKPVDLAPISTKPVDIKQMDIKHLGTAGQSAVDGRRAEKLETGSSSAKAADPVARRQPPEVEVSAEAKAIGAALVKAAGLPDVDQAKVTRVKAAIEEGRYSVSAQRLADKMLRFETFFKESIKENAKERS